jgi:hypothetical protein
MNQPDALVHRSTLYNNAGVQLLVRSAAQATSTTLTTPTASTPSYPFEYLDIALHLFQGALESKIDLERNGAVVDDRRGGTVTDPVALDEFTATTAATAMSYSIQVAEWHYQNLPAYYRSMMAQTPTATTTSVSAASSAPMADPFTRSTVPFTMALFSSSTTPIDTTAGTAGVTTVPFEHRGCFAPYLYAHPFDIPITTSTSSPFPTMTNHMSDMVIGSIIVYNLGLVHQLMHRNSKQAASLYELSAYLLTDLPKSNDTLLLRTALLNNFGVWCLENGDGESMLTCMEYLSMALSSVSDTVAVQPKPVADSSVVSASTDSTGHSNDDTAIVHDPSQPHSQFLNAAVVQGMRSNIEHILTPHHGSSPAA